MNKGIDGMETIISLMGQIFHDDISVDEFWHNTGVLFAWDDVLQEEQSDFLFQSLYDLLGDTDLTDNHDGMARFFIFLGGLAHAARKPQSEHLWLDKALIYINSQEVRQQVEALHADTLKAFLPYASQSEALDDYMFLFHNMGHVFGEDNEEDLINPKPLGDVYSPTLEIGFFEDFDRLSLVTYREFSDFLKAIRLREAVTLSLDVPLFHYIRLSRRFELTTLQVMVMLFLFFSATSDNFARMLEDHLGTFSGAVPSVGLINRFVQRTFGVDSVVADVLAPEGQLCKWGLVHLQTPEGMELASVLQNLVFLDDAVVQFLHTGNPGEGHFLYKTRSTGQRPQALENGSELAELIHSAGSRVFIRNTGGLCVADEVFAQVKDTFSGVDVFSLDRAMGEGRRFRMEMLKSAFLHCALRNTYPVFELTGTNNEQHQQEQRMVLQDLNDVASGVEQGFAVTCEQDIFELVYQHIRDVACFNMLAPRDARQVEQWKYWLDYFGITLDDRDKRQVLNIFPRTRLNVRKVLSKLRNRGRIDFDVIKKAVYEDMDADFGVGVQRITPVFDWDSIVLPTETLVRINEILTFYRYREKVMKEWDFERSMPYGRAISVLFYGPPGTGKTMMAHVIARDLGMDMFKVDLSAILSKYIGETEKRLRRVFDAAQESPTILVFDEADSLFTKRTEVSNSTDRYANVEVNFLLQQMEEFNGITVLTTNNYGNIDEAFRRRIRFKIKFPMPDAETRAKLWQVMLPAKAQVAQDLKFDELGKEFEFSPAHIKNAVLRAAFMAAERGEPVSQQDLMDAAKVEAKDLGLAVRDQ